MPGGIILYGRQVAQAVGHKIKLDVALLKSSFDVYPKLVVIEVGELPQSKLYIKQKFKFAKKYGILLSHMRLPSHISESLLLDYVYKLNADSSVHGITLQLPFDSDTNINVTNSLNAVATHKDVEGLNSYNTALLSRGDILCPHCEGLKQKHTHIPCTAAACYALIRHVNFPISGSRCVIIGRGRLVGAPTAELLSGSCGATVIQCHLQSANIDEEINRGDIIISGVGHPGLIKGDWVRPGALVIDCGYSVMNDPQNPSKSRCFGDVEFNTALEKAKWITPVPGGVGPVSIAMLFRNTVNSAQWSVGLSGSMCNCSYSSESDILSKGYADRKVS
uniref:Methenyltetrahydrofolate cyclohydrolase n=1 Tax=Schistosoma japonicum TaxID=6182 RepID=B3GUY3_SCHJA